MVGTVTVVLIQIFAGAERTAATTWASILILLRRIFLISCSTVGITNRSILRQNQGLDSPIRYVYVDDSHRVIFKYDVILFTGFVFDKSVIDNGNICLWN